MDTTPRRTPRVLKTMSRRSRRRGLTFPWVVDLRVTCLFRSNLRAPEAQGNALVYAEIVG